MIKISINKHRNRFFIYAGCMKLSKGFKTQEEAQAEYEKRDSFYKYWAGSAAASIVNTPPVIVYLDA